MYKKATSKVKIESLSSNPFNIYKGLKQEHKILPTLLKENLEQSLQNTEENDERQLRNLEGL